jgi:DNA repair protein RecO (recombination protein O)
MEWRDEGVIIGLKRHGEASAIVEMMTRAHGRHLGLVRGGRSPRQQTVLQPGNSAHCVWRARLEEHLGLFTLEVGKVRAAEIMDSPLALQGVNLAGALLRLLPERDPHPALFDMFDAMADHLGNAGIAPALMVRFELAILTELGFGLDLTRCAATGQAHDLAYVSPKSGRAVSREAGAPWRERMLALPGFLARDMAIAPTERAEIDAGFALTGYFLERDVFGPRGLKAPLARAAYVALAQKPQRAGEPTPPAPAA